MVSNEFALVPRLAIRFRFSFTNMYSHFVTRHFLVIKICVLSVAGAGAAFNHSISTCFFAFPSIFKAKQLKNKDCV